MDSTLSLVIGVVSGIITTTIIYCAVTVFKQVIVPWYRQLIYRGVIVSGEWKEVLDFGNGKTQRCDFQLQQAADTLTGHAVVMKFLNDHLQSTEMFRLTGTISDRLVHLIIRPASKSRLGLGAQLMEVIGDGSRLTGFSVWYDSGSAKIHALPVVWLRKTRSD